MADFLFRLLALIRKELLSVLKDPSSRVILFLPVLLQSLLFAPAAIVMALLGWLGVPGRRRRGIDLAFAAIAGWGKMTWWRRVGLYHVEQPMIEPRRGDVMLVKEPGG